LKFNTKKGGKNKAKRGKKKAEAKAEMRNKNG